MSSDASLLTGSTSRMLTTFRANAIPCEVVNGRLNLIKYQTKSGEWRFLRGMLSEKLPLFSKQVCDDKLWTSYMFEGLNLPTAETMEVSSKKELDAFLAVHQTAVIKPRSGAHGHGVSMNVTARTKLAVPLKLARAFDRDTLVQRQITGTDVRLLVIGDKVVSALERRPAAVAGDGVHTVYELVRLENKKPERGNLGIDTLVEISLKAVKQFLTDAELRRVPALGEVVRVVGPSNQSMGGTVHDITETLQASLRDDTIRLTKHLQLPIAGVDCILSDDGYYFLEINASPGIAIHDDPVLGITSGCFKTYMQLLYEDTWWQE